MSFISQGAYSPSSLTKPPPGSHPLRVLDTGQKPSLREGGQGKSGQEAHAHPTHTCLLIHTCRHMCVYMHYKHKHTHTCARAFCTSMHLFSFYLLLVKSLATSWGWVGEGNYTMRAAERNYRKGWRSLLRVYKKNLRASGFLFVYFFVFLCSHTRALHVHIFAGKSLGQYAYVQSTACKEALTFWL